jgi:hypothetical protein
VGEALRTGSHKAIMLDYLDITGQSNRATEVIGLTRAYSKYAAGASAICGGVILFAFQEFAPLFWLSALPSAAGAVLMYFYPRYLDGECARASADEQTTAADWRAAVWALFSNPKTSWLMMQSVLFESQIKIVVEYYAQPMLKVGLAKYGIDLLKPSSGASGGTGAIWIGAFEWFRETLGGGAARASDRFQKTLSSSQRALDSCYVAAALLGLLACGIFLLWSEWTVLAAAYFVLLTILQNIRRPIFVSALNAEMEKSMRATILSLESVARSTALAVMLPLIGLIADNFGLPVALAVPPLVLLVAFFVGMCAGARSELFIGKAVQE